MATKTNVLNLIKPSVTDKFNVDYFNQNMDIIDDTIRQGVIEVLYPVGSIYLSTNDTNPSTMFGGTWELYASGKTLVGVDPDDPDFNEPGKGGGRKPIN